MTSRLINIPVTSGGLERREKESNYPVAAFFVFLTLLVLLKDCYRSV